VEYRVRQHLLDDLKLAPNAYAGRYRADCCDCCENSSKPISRHRSPWSAARVVIVHLLWRTFLKLMIQLLRHNVNLGSTLTL
jgi:hypothetical protein